MAIAAIGEGGPLRNTANNRVCFEDRSPGDSVHQHQRGTARFRPRYRFAEAAKNDEILPPELRDIEGSFRPNGKIGTRNYIGILTSDESFGLGSKIHRRGK